MILIFVLVWCSLLPRKQDCIKQGKQINKISPSIPHWLQQNGAHKGEHLGSPHIDGQLLFWYSLLCFHLKFIMKTFICFKALAFMQASLNNNMFFVHYSQLHRQCSYQTPPQESELLSLTLTIWVRKAPNVFFWKIQITQHALSSTRSISLKLIWEQFSTPGSLPSKSKFQIHFLTIPAIKQQ